MQFYAKGIKYCFRRHKMELLLGVLFFGAIFALWFFNRKSGFDANKDGKVDVKDVKPLVQNTVVSVKEAADVNKDGKVNKADAKEAVKKVAKKVSKPKAAKKPKMTVAN